MGDASHGPATGGHLGTEPRVCFVDLSVYSRNRCFRIFKSSKVGTPGTRRGDDAVGEMLESACDRKVLSAFR